MLDLTTIIVTLIPAVASIATVIIKAKGTNEKIDESVKERHLHQLKNEISDLIDSDYINYLMKLPMTNYKDILELQDNYDSLGGNTWVHRRVEEYIKFYEKVNTGMHRNTIDRKKKSI